MADISQKHVAIGAREYLDAGTNEVSHLALEFLRNLLFVCFSPEIGTARLHVSRSCDVLNITMPKNFPSTQGRPTPLLDLSLFTIEGKDCRSDFAITHS